MASEIPNFEADEAIQALIERFQQALASIREALQSYLLSEGTRKDLLAAEKEIQVILSDTETYIDENSETLLHEIITGALVAAYTMLSLPIKESTSAATTFSIGVDSIFFYLVRSMRTDLKAVTASLRRQSSTILHRSYRERMRTSTISTTTTRKASRQQSRETKMLLDESDIAIIDKAGRRWKTKHYVEMLTNTLAMEAYRETVAQTGLEKGSGLAYISYNQKTNDRCKDFQYKIVKLSPNVNAPYPYYRDLDHIWHPNCRHYLVPFDTFDSLPVAVKAANGIAA